VNWAQEEFKNAHLQDARLTKRAAKLVDRLAAHPGQSIPNACRGWAETQAAYRFLSNRRVRWEDVMKAHWDASIERMRSHEVVLHIQDTTELDFNGRQSDGLGRLTYEAQRGMYLHPTYAVSATREPLGVLDAWMWAREPKGSDGQRDGVRESVRWLEGYERVADLAQEMAQVRHVYVADREADILALLRMADEMEHAADYLIRCKHDRALPDGARMWARLAQAPELGQVCFDLPAGRGRKARSVTQNIRARQFELDDAAGGTLSVWCILAEELDPPTGSKPVVWRLLSNRPVHTLQEAVQLIDWYRMRWEIEVFFLILKEGCRVEALQLGHIERIETALALYMIVAWRINRAMRLSRTQPQTLAHVLFEEQEWRTAYVLNKKQPPKTVPPLNTVVRLIAQLGGFLGRKADGEPGAKTLWRGMQTLSSFIQGLHLAGIKL